MGKVETISLLIIAGLIITLFAFLFSYQTQTETAFYDVYHAECPFGILWVEIQGGAVFVYGSGIGVFDSSLRETYIIKYHIGNELHTANLRADQYPVVIDGTFRMEYRIKRRRNALVNTEWEIYSRKPVAIHVPDLPPVNETVKWIIVP